MPMTAKEMVKLLERNGFQYIRSNGSHRLEYGGGFEHLGRFELNTFVAVN